jgi:hypothetical protein
MKITAEITLRVRLADGTEMDVARTAVLQHGDNPNLAGSGAEKAIEAAARPALLALAAGIAEIGEVPAKPTLEATVRAARDRAHDKAVDTALRDMLDEG